MADSTSWSSCWSWWFVAAVRASQLGKKVEMVEKKYWGGVCLDVGWSRQGPDQERGDLAPAHPRQGGVRHRGRRRDVLGAHDDAPPGLRRHGAQRTLLMKKNKSRRSTAGAPSPRRPRWTSRSATAPPAVHPRPPDHRRRSISRMLPGVEVSRTSSPTRRRSSTRTCPARSSSAARGPSASSSPSS